MKDIYVVMTHQENNSVSLPMGTYNSQKLAEDHVTGLKKMSPAHAYGFPYVMAIHRPFDKEDE